MFTGIVEEIGIIKMIVAVLLGKRFFIEAKTVLIDLQVGDSIAVNGVCLTATEFTSQGFWVEAVAETLRLTNLGTLEAGSTVNLERAMTLQKRLGGHLLQGHIDATGTILKIEPEGQALLITLSFPAALRKYMIKKGYIGFDGMSLTLIEVYPTEFTLTLIPHTQEVTIAQNYQIGQHINLEVDMLAKYIENFVQTTHSVLPLPTH
ncbi:MAG: riboflavin synthase [Gammaproteobacteria bacterium]|nr:riboflavin synthase [Gammaproteobacteria bacterium]